MGPLQMCALMVAVGGATAVAAALYLHFHPGANR